jgi:HEAT repeat protein
MDLKMLPEIPPWEWPEDTDKMLLEVLVNERASAADRLIAAELAGDIIVMNDEIADALLSIAQSKDHSEELRGRAAISLGPVLELADTDGFDDPEDIPISESAYHKIRDLLYRLYTDASVPKKVRRRILEASVRAPQDWHKGAVRAAYYSDDEDWRLTAVFSMRWIRGFEREILEALESDNQDVHYEAVCAAGNWEIDAAWSHISALVTSPDTEKFLLMAAIEAVADIRPQEAGMILLDLTESEDEDIVEAVHEAITMAEGQLGYEADEFGEDDDFDGFDEFDEDDDEDDNGYIH